MTLSVRYDKAFFKLRKTILSCLIIKQILKIKQNGKQNKEWRKKIWI